MTSTTAPTIDQRVAFVAHGIGTATVYTGIVVGFVSEARDAAKIEITSPVNTGRVFTVSVRDCFDTVAEAKAVAAAVAAAVPAMTAAEMSHAHGYGRGRYTGD